ncbi:uncharacterized protein KY384_002273 [Bacidia gigantensis]|uniref:uncharacterized protein n=1 Tax=Bacidia gigantensis TaxID=2732470 RepID=UPI001D0529AF|nr:uncharacterized protein KY384_002273 [Bacidia gigantensis]KAG8533490.1 hypothetical protein KY384_002273 [Bacidia gigantensis]
MATAASPLPIPAPSRNFVFINDTNPDDSKSKSKRKLVRAQAARGPHANAPDGAKGEKTANTTTKHQQLKCNKKERNAVTTFPLSLIGLEDLTTPTPTTTTSTKIERVTIQVKEMRREESSDSLTTENKDPLETAGVSAPAAAIPALKQSDSAEESSSPSTDAGSTLVPRMPGTGWVAPFISHPDPEKPYIPMLVDHYLSNIAVNIPELDAGTPYILRLKWFPMVITSPSTLYIVLLTSASHFAAFNNLLPRSEIQMILLNLKQATFNAINKEIRDANARAESAGVRGGGYMADTIIGAVAKMASYEAMFGKKELFHTHMRGLWSMVQGRGGLGSLGLDGLLERMVLWIDINSAFLLDSKPYFEPRRPLAGQTGWVEEPNMVGFLGAS